jgi:hypothetical protein
MAIPAPAHLFDKIVVVQDIWLRVQRSDRPTTAATLFERESYRWVNTCDSYKSEMHIGGMNQPFMRFRLSYQTT